MNIVPEKSFFGGTETFKVGKTIVIADKGTAKVVQNDDGSIQVLGGENVNVKTDEQNTKISLKDSKVSQFIAMQGKNRIEMEKCRFQQGGNLALATLKALFMPFNKSEKYVPPSVIVIGGENNDVLIDGDLNGALSCYTIGDNDSAKKDKIVITGNNNARITSGIHDEIEIRGKNQNEKCCEKLDDIKVTTQMREAQAAELRKRINDMMQQHQMNNMCMQPPINQGMMHSKM